MLKAGEIVVDLFITVKSDERFSAAKFAITTRREAVVYRAPNLTSNLR